MTKLAQLRGHLWGIIAVMILVITTSLFFIPVLVIGLMKLIPNQKWRITCTTWIDNIVTFWCDMNNAYIDRTQKVNWKIHGIDDLHLNQDSWYLVVANHQSWLDIVLLQRLFNRKIPMLKFFIKDQLKWVPLLGFAWWAMGMPFMKRYSKEYLLKNPQKRGQDLQATQKALELFKKTPSSVINFIEGTRFTAEKKAIRKSPYQNLLQPKAGGVSFAISAMSEKIHSLLDVTIVYPDKKHSLWDFLCLRMRAITVDVRFSPIPGKFVNTSLASDNQLQMEFRDWLNELWAQKDRLINSLQGSFKQA